MRRALLTSLVLVAIAVPVCGQGNRSQIAGFVKDQSGGVIPGATVTITNSQTQLPWIALTDARGYYVFPALPPSIYAAEIALQDFKKLIQTSNTLDAPSSSALYVTLETGAVAETITV